MAEITEQELSDLLYRKDRGRTLMAIGRVMFQFGCDAETAMKEETRLLRIQWLKDSGMDEAQATNWAAHSVADLVKSDK